MGQEVQDGQLAVPLVSGSNLISRAKLLGKFVSIQLVTQGVGVASGILLVRTMSRREYAYLTIANSMLATMNVLADTGLTIGVSSIGGKVWSDRHRFGQLIATTLRLRRFLAGIAASIVTPILAWLLVSKGATYAYAGSLCLVVLVALNYQLMTIILVAVPRFLSQIGRVQFLEFASALLRLVLLTAAYFVLLNAAMALLATVATLMLQYFLLRRWAPDGIDLHAPVNAEYRATMLGIVRMGVPTTLFYCVQGQATVWLASFFGSTQNVAEIGALARLAIMFSVIGSVMTTIVLPRFAKYQSSSLLRRRYLQITGGFVLFGLGLIALTALLPGPLLWILGSKYASLRRELLLMMTLTVLNSTAEAMWSLNSAKAWIKHSWLNIPGTLAVQAVLFAVLNVSTLHGVLWFAIISLFPNLLLNVALASNGIKSAARST